MAFLRFTRDKRGYEQFALVQPTTNRRGATRQRILYVYRTPPDVKVGREPFDDAVRRALETQYPDVSFDWRQILETPIPSADAERWRERRRADRAAKQAASAEAALEGADANADDAPGAVEEPGVPAVLQPPAPAGVPATTATTATIATIATTLPGGDATRRRRRRRRGRRGRPDGPVAAPGTDPGIAPGPDPGPNPGTIAGVVTSDSNHAAHADETDQTDQSHRAHESDAGDTPNKSAGE